MFSGFSYWILAVFSAYFAILIGIAVFRSRQMQAMSDYVLGSRRVGAFTSALSASSSAASGWTILVFPALAFSQGTIHLWTVLGVVSGLWFSWTIIAKRLRRYTIAAEDALTVPEFLEKRFGDKTGTLRTLAGLITIFFVIFYISSGLIAGAKLLETVFGLGYGMGILTTLIAVASYTFIGGFLAVSKTDVFQAMIMLTGIIVLPLTLIFATDAPFRETGAAPPGFWNPLIQAKGDTIGPFFLLSAAGWGLGYLGSQRVVQRFMAVESEAKIPASRNIGVAWLILIDLFAILTGLVALAALAEVGMLAEVMQDPERLYLVASEVFFHPVVSGLLLTAVVAAVMSTADSQLLLASAIATDDLPIIKRYAYAIGTRARVWLGRFLLVVVGAIACALSIIHPESVFNLVSYAWGGMAAAFGPVTIMALYWRRFNLWGALASIITGTVVASIWGYMPGGPWGLWDIQPATPGCLIAVPVAVVVTLITPGPSEEVVQLFDRVNSPKTTGSPSAAF
jgi:sodium/proline symporter